MLTTAELELLTAAVDGVLNARQQRRLEHLLVHSAEARKVYARLQQDAAALRSLPRRTCPTDLSGSVLSAISQQPPRKTTPRRPITPAPEPLAGGVPAWFALVLAASVLMVIGTGSYLYFDASQAGQGRPQLERTAPDLVQRVPAPVPDPERERESVPPIDPSTPPVEPPQPPEPGPVVVQQPPITNPGMEPLAPEPVGPIFTGPSGERIVMRTIEPTVPTLHRLHDMERDRFLSDLGKASAFRLELPCRDAGKAVERIQPLFKAEKLNLTVDSVARARLDRPQWKSSYMIVLDDITPEELTTFLEHLAVADRKGDPRKGDSGAMVLPARFVLSRLNKYDQRDLADHLGTELSTIPAPRTDGPLGVDPTRSLAEQTAEDIARKLDANANLRPALLLAYGMPRLGGPTADIKRFLESRKPARPGTLQVMLVLRHVG